MTIRNMLLASSVVFAAPTDQGSDAPEVFSASQREQQARDMAFKADADETFNSDVREGVLAKERSLLASVNIYFGLLDLYGADTLDTFPEPGTQDDPEKANYSQNPAIYKRPTRRKNGVGMAAANWINDFADNLKFVREEIREPLAAIVDSPTATELQKDAAERKFNGRLSTARSQVSQAIALHHQIARCSAYPAVTFEWEQDEVPAIDADGNREKNADGTDKTVMELASTAAPICIVSAKNPRKDFFYLTVQQFLGLDFDLARQNGGTVDALMATKSRDGSAGEDAGDGINVTNREELLSAMSSEASYFDEGKNYTNFLAWLKVENDDSNETLLVASKLAAYYSGMIAPHAKRIERLENAAAQAKDAA